jgi:hypothetical protein
MRCQWLQISVPNLESTVWTELGPVHEDAGQAADWLEKQDLQAGCRYRLALDPIGTVVQLVGLDAIRAAAKPAQTIPIEQPLQWQMEIDPHWPAIQDALICAESALRPYQLAKRLNITEADLRASIAHHKNEVAVLESGYLALASRAAELSRPGKIIDVEPERDRALVPMVPKTAGAKLIELLLERYPQMVTPREIINLGYDAVKVQKAFDNARTRNIACVAIKAKDRELSQYQALESWVASKREPSSPEEN